jgi:hypothetical protein
MEEMVFRRTSLKDLILAQPGPDSLNVWLANCYSELSPVERECRRVGAVAIDKGLAI